MWCLGVRCIGCGFIKTPVSWHLKTAPKVVVFSISLTVTPCNRVNFLILLSLLLFFIKAKVKILIYIKISLKAT
jgi:hypothetical protein